MMWPRWRLVALALLMPAVAYAQAGKPKAVPKAAPKTVRNSPMKFEALVGTWVGTSKTRVFYPMVRPNCRVVKFGAADSLVECPDSLIIRSDTMARWAGQRTFEPWRWGEHREWVPRPVELLHTKPSTSLHSRTSSSLQLLKAKPPAFL